MSRGSPIVVEKRDSPGLPTAGGVQGERYDHILVDEGEAPEGAHSTARAALLERRRHKRIQRPQKQEEQVVRRSPHAGLT